MDTIYAPGSARGKAGVAVIRISGPDAWDAVQALCGDVPPVRRASVRALREEGSFLDEALVLTFAQGSSFTGEKAAELQIHGSTATMTAVLSALGRRPGLRMAEAGEFTRRALENGRLDLAQVEGLADLIDAETEAQRRQALRVLSGALGEKAEGWRRALVRAAALLEVTIDFADEDVPVDVAPEVLELLAGVRGDLEREISGVAISERIRDGFEVAIVGRPNVGKSTLLNALAGREAAITSEIAGTTRDVIEVRMDLGGVAVTLLDTAGLHDADNPVERIGVQRARERGSAADIRIFVLDEPDEVPMIAVQPGDFVVLGKADGRVAIPDGWLAVSGLSGEGLDELTARVGDLLHERVAGAGVATRLRHESAMRLALASIIQASDEVLLGPARTELAAEELRRGVRALESLVGRVDVEDLLDDIFASFCIGK